MPKTAIIQTDFSAGELTPRMKGRVDTSRYQKGAETIENAVVAVHGGVDRRGGFRRSEEHTSELQALMRITYAVFCLKKKNKQRQQQRHKDRYNCNYH